MADGLENENIKFHYCVNEVYLFLLILYQCCQFESFVSFPLVRRLSHCAHQKSDGVFAECATATPPPPKRHVTVTGFTFFTVNMYKVLF